MKLVHVTVNDLLLMYAELIILDVQNPVHIRRERLSAPADHRVLSPGHTGADSLRTGNRLACHVHSVRSRLRQADQADDRPLPNGLQLHVLSEIHVAPVLHLQAHIPAPLEELRHLAVLSRQGRLSPRHRKYMQMPQRKLLPDLLL